MDSLSDLHHLIIAAAQGTLAGKVGAAAELVGYIEAAVNLGVDLPPAWTAAAPTLARAVLADLDI